MIDFEKDNFQQRRHVEVISNSVVDVKFSFVSDTVMEWNDNTKVSISAF